MKLLFRWLPSSSNSMTSIRAVPIPCGEPAVHLALDYHGVDPHPAVVHRDEALDLDLPRTPVYLHDADVSAERVRHLRRVVVGDALEAGLLTLGDVGVGGEGDLLHASRPGQGSP